MASAFACGPAPDAILASRRRKGRSSRGLTPWAAVLPNSSVCVTPRSSARPEAGRPGWQGVRSSFTRPAPLARCHVRGSWFPVPSATQSYATASRRSHLVAERLPSASQFRTGRQGASRKRRQATSGTISIRLGRRWSKGWGSHEVSFIWFMAGGRSSARCMATSASTTPPAPSTHCTRTRVTVRLGAQF